MGQLSSGPRIGGGSQYVKSRFREIVTEHINRFGPSIFLILVGLATRLPLLSISLDEVDAANFHNALAYGYDVPGLRPHPPGYPLYIFMGWIIDQLFRDPLLSLTVLSALMGSLVAVPFYLLLKEFTGTRVALAGSLLLLFNPLAWSLSEAALSDTTSLFFAMLLASLSFRGRRSDSAFLLACVVASLAIGVRQPNMALMPLLLFPLGYRLAVAGQFPWRLAGLGSQLFAITTIAWLMPAVHLGSEGFPDYLRAFDKQYTTAVRIYDITNVESPLVLNVPYRMERFLSGYFFTHPWTGNDAKTATSLLLVCPWLVGIALFVVAFDFRRPTYIFLAIWLASIAYLLVMIHFLPRYGLPQLPAFIIAGVLGYRFLVEELWKQPHRLTVLGMVGIGCLLLLYAIKYQPPIPAFEFTPPGLSLHVAAFLMLGVAFVLGARVVYRRRSAVPEGAGEEHLPDSFSMVGHTSLIAFLALLVIPYAIQGYRVASIAHNNPNPNQQMVLFVKERFDTSRITPCWDNQSHSFFEAIIPGVVPTGYWAVDDLYSAHDSGDILLVTERCVWYQELEDSLGLVEVSTFSGGSPLWSKTPTVHLYATEPPRPAAPP